MSLTTGISFDHENVCLSRKKIYFLQMMQHTVVTLEGNRCMKNCDVVMIYIQVEIK